MLVFSDPSAELSLSKVNAVEVIFYSSVLFIQPGLRIVSDMSMRIYFIASIAESIMLCANVSLC